MINYTIYVTETIAKKALEKGAEMVRLQTMSAEQYNSGHGYTRAKDQMYFAVSPSIIDADDENALDIYFTPTAEQICGWLREKFDINITINPKFNGDYDYYGYTYIRNKQDYGVANYGNNYKEVLLDIIDKALDLI